MFAERSGDLSKVAEIRYGRIVQLQKELETAKTRMAEIQGEQRMLKEEVSPEDVAAVVTK